MQHRVILSDGGGGVTSNVHVHNVDLTATQQRFYSFHFMYHGRWKRHSAQLPYGCANLWWAAGWMKSDEFKYGAYICWWWLTKVFITAGQVKWEKLARFMGIPNPEIEYIKSQGDKEEQKSKMLVCWKQRFGSKATYKAMAKALLQIGRTDLAETIISFRCLSLDTGDTQADNCNQTEPRATPPSPGSGSGIGKCLRKSRQV